MSDYLEAYNEALSSVNWRSSEPMQSVCDRVAVAAGMIRDKWRRDAEERLCGRAVNKDGGIHQKEGV